MSGRKEQAIHHPHVGMVIREDDPRGGGIKRIVATDPWYVYTQAGRDGSGRRSRIKRKRLAEGRYELLNPSSKEKP